MVVCHPAAKFHHLRVRHYCERMFQKHCYTSEAAVKSEGGRLSLKGFGLRTAVMV